MATPTETNSQIPPVAGPSEDVVPGGLQAIVLILDADAQQSDVVKQVVEALEKAGNMADLRTKKAKLRIAVQRTFTLRQSLLRAELLEMQTRMLQTQAP